VIGAPSMPEHGHPLDPDARIGQARPQEVMMRGSFSLCCVVWLLAAGCQDNQTAKQAPDQGPAQAPGQASGQELGQGLDQTAREAPPDDLPGAVPAGIDPQYAADMADICFSQERSGALEHDEGQRTMVVAQWLGTRIRTQQGRDFLAAMARAEAAQKVTLLQTEIRKVGGEECPLAVTWAGHTPE
jgi:hypothetical protein